MNGLKTMMKAMITACMVSVSCRSVLAYEPETASSYLFQADVHAAENVILAHAETCLKSFGSLLGMNEIPALSEYSSEIVSAYREENLPRIITFIDDDVTSDVFVDKYHDACMHNGITGNYAVITGHISRGHTSLDHLKAYREEGFDMLMHCDWQASYWKRASRDNARCRKDLQKCKQMLAEYGLEEAIPYWITPFGYHDEALTQIGKDMGAECLVSTVNYVHNSLEDYDPYFIRRCALGPDDEKHPEQSVAGVKIQIDKWIHDGGWMIITTHFNEWGDIPYDTSPDENGYPIGYARFNETVQYALSQHDVIYMSFTGAFRCFNALKEKQ